MAADLLPAVNFDQFWVTTAAAHPELQGLQVDCDPQGVPHLWCGRRAVVYRIRTIDGRVRALRVVRNDDPGRLSHYAEAREFLRRYPAPGLVDCRCLTTETGSSADGNLVFLMDWAPGITLGAYVDEQVQAGRGEALLRLAERWRELCRALDARGIVHGDLEPGNILVQPDGGLMLIDYDGLAAPSQMGRSTIEAGTAPFQHPERKAHTALFSGLDRYSTLLIYVALRALAADPTLRVRYSTVRPYVPLLFQDDDFTSPDAPLFADLAASSDEQVRELAYYLCEVRSGPLADVPSLDESLLWCNSVGSLLAQRDFDGAAALVARLGSQERLDPRLLPALDDAWRRVERRYELERALETNEAGKIAAAYVPELLDDYPAAAVAVQRARQVLEGEHALQGMRAAIDERRWQDFVELWNERRGLVEGLASAQPLRRLHDDLITVVRLEALVDDPLADDRVIGAQWQAVHAEGEPPAVERLRQAWERRIARRELFEKITQLVAVAGRSPTFQGDKELRDAWKEAEATGETRLPSLRAHYRLAKRRMGRLQWLNDLSRSPTLLGEQQIAACSRYLPRDYHPKLPGRIQLAQRRLDAVRILHAALTEPISERALAEAAAGLVATRGEALIDEGQRARVELAHRRVALIDALEACRALPLDQRDRRVIEGWNDVLPLDCPDAAGVRPLWNEAHERLDLLAQIRERMEQTDGDDVERLLADPRLNGYPVDVELESLFAAYRERLRQARLRRRHDLVQAILEHEPERFRQAFDRELVAELCVQVPQHQRIVAAWTEREILPRDKSGLSCEPVGGVQWRGSCRCRITWTWPASTVTDRCEVALSRDVPTPRSIPEDLDLLDRRTLDRDPRTTETPSVEFNVPCERFGATVVVWPVIDLGFQTFYGEPLTLGQLRPPDQ